MTITDTDRLQFLCKRYKTIMFMPNACMVIREEGIPDSIFKIPGDWDFKKAIDAAIMEEHKYENT